MIIGIINHKGGVGKTTTTINLGKALALTGKKVLLIDLDPQANLSQWLNQENAQHSIFEAIMEASAMPIMNIGERMDFVPSSLQLAKAEVSLHSEPDGYFRLRTCLEDVENKYDYVLIDCPPSLGLLTSNALIAANSVLVPVQTQFLASKGLETIEEAINKIRRSLNRNLTLLGILFTQTNRTILSQSIRELVGTAYEGQVFSTLIRQNIALAESSAHNQSIFEYAPNSNGAEDYLALAQEIITSYTDRHE
jgi:chromosome partitioning protein